MTLQLSRHIVVWAVLAFLLAGCGGRPPAPAPYPGTGGVRTQRPYQINGVWYYPLPTAQGYVEEGMASWYGADFHGKPTSCGEPYNMYAMTAAHKTLPLGTHVKVTNLENGRSTILKVNDRGPFVSGRIIDLSITGAQCIGSYQKGLARVRVEAVQLAQEEHQGAGTVWRVENAPQLRYGNFTIQIGSFKEQINAQRLRDRLAPGYREIQVLPGMSEGGSIFRVQVGRFQDLMIAQQELQRLRGSGFQDAFVVAME